MKTPSAAGELPTPWSLSGIANQLAPKVVSFHLNCAYPLGADSDEKENLELSGRWEVSSTPLVVRDDIQLRGWQVYSLGPITNRTSEGTLYDYGALRIADFTTVGELRRTLLDRPEQRRAPSLCTPGD
jgi:hypothetical protein